MIRPAGVLVVLALAVAACSGDDGPAAISPTSTTSTTAAEPVDVTSGVPDEWRALAAELAASLAAYDRSLPEGGGTPVRMGVELLTANGNQGEVLLAPNASARDTLMLDALADLGVDTVTVDIPFPLLDPAYPRADEYLAYYRSLAEEIRRRGLGLMIETQVVFAGTEFSPLDIDYVAMPVEDFLAGRTAQTALIARELRPDQLAFLTEASTQEMLIGHPISEDRLVRFVQDTVSAAAEPDVSLGAGQGSWEDPALTERLAADTDLDFIDIHVYPLATPGRDLLQAAAGMADVAHAHGKGAVIGEAWLYKVSKSEAGTTTTFTTAFDRDLDAYWSPLDAEFLRVTNRLAAHHGIDLVSYFWAQLLFAYLPDDSPADLPTADARRLANQRATAAMDGGERSDTGEAFAALANG